jgi:hypothetical protein
MGALDVIFNIQLAGGASNGHSGFYFLHPIGWLCVEQTLWMLFFTSSWLVVRRTDTLDVIFYIQLAGGASNRHSGCYFLHPIGWWCVEQTL